MIANLVPFVALSEIGLRPGDTVIVAPATSRFGGGALAIGATVVAYGRSETTLKRMKEVFAHTEEIKSIILAGDREKDAHLMIEASENGGKGADAYTDFSPAAVAESTHIASALTALRPFGKAVFMGGIWGHIKLEYNMIIMRTLRIQVCHQYHLAL